MSIVVFVIVACLVVSFGVKIKLKPKLEKALKSSVVNADFVEILIEIPTKLRGSHYYGSQFRLNEPLFHHERLNLSI